MPRCILAVLCLGLVGLPALAQDAPKRIEVFGGYQFLHDGNFDGLGDGSANTSGWNAAATFNFNRHFGFTADFSGNYQTKQLHEEGTTLVDTADIHIYTYAFGPTVSVSPGGKLRLFAHALFGDASVRPNACIIFSGSPDECGSGGATGMAMIFGGGVDIPAKATTALRLIQVDWMYLPSESGAQLGNIRVSSGLIFRF